MATKGHIPGGGIASNKHVETSVRTGSGSRSARPAGVAQIGTAVGDRVTNRPGSTGYKGEKMHGPADRNFQQTKFGNEVALNVGKGGPGAGRTIHASGSQATHGQTVSGNPPAKSTDILRQFGPDYHK
jgi:hypothetical protein